MTRGPRCITWSYLLIPTAQPGKFSVDNHRDPGAEAEELQVQDTDYTTFALMVSRRQSGSQSILRVYLLCRMWAIEIQALDKFVCLLRAQGLSEDNIVFPGSAGDVCRRGCAWVRARHLPAGGGSPMGAWWVRAACLGSTCGGPGSHRGFTQLKLRVLMAPWCLPPPGSHAPAHPPAHSPAHPLVHSPAYPPAHSPAHPPAPGHLVLHWVRGLMQLPEDQLWGRAAPQGGHVPQPLASCPSPSP
ncbi:epididymal-specific lipocalin-12 isoform X2 [Desmodus rotundus]|uniref:epididymal-specific lipocalin-12 isoform X2 n=1 Tax=Desmodus rotundus TaxID=9430 RepID=UPI00238188BD|nr:epididymal-specific lipocalin-12 isoform X3 [Desmodus rotundus]